MPNKKPKHPGLPVNNKEQPLEWHKAPHPATTGTSSYVFSCLLQSSGPRVEDDLSAGPAAEKAASAVIKSRCSNLLTVTAPIETSSRHRHTTPGCRTHQLNLHLHHIQPSRPDVHMSPAGRLKLSTCHYTGNSRASPSLLFGLSLKSAS